MKNSQPYSENVNLDITLTDSTVSRLVFKDVDGNGAWAKKIDLRIRPDDVAWDGKCHIKLFNRHLQASYTCDEFTATSNYIYLHVIESRFIGDFKKNDRLVVSGTTGTLNDGTYTVSAVDVVSGRIRITTVENIAATQAAGSPGTAVNCVTSTDFWLNAEETRLTVDFFCGEIQFLSIDTTAGAFDMYVWVDAYSDQDISGVTII